jgi:hypothetical protein
MPRLEFIPVVAINKYTKLGHTTMYVHLTGAQLHVDSRMFGMKQAWMKT